MSIIFSRQCEYALQSVLFLALKDKDELVSIKEFNETLKIPFHFLAKILQDLTHKGLLKSHKGPTGGFSLAMPAKDITLLHIIESIDGLGFMNNCVLGFPECSEKHPCALHEQWEKSREGIYNVLENKNIEEMAYEMRKPQYVVSNSDK